MEERGDKRRGGVGVSSNRPSGRERRCMEYTQHSACSEHGPPRPSRVEIRTRTELTENELLPSHLGSGLVEIDASKGGSRGEGCVVGSFGG